jgi:hypothetical protein
MLDVEAYQRGGPILSTLIRLLQLLPSASVAQSHGRELHHSPHPRDGVTQQLGGVSLLRHSHASP